jgi:hypothetical protein
MATAIAEKSSSEVQRSPSVLVPLIKSALASAQRTHQEVADLFVEAREGFDTSAEFLSWAFRHFNIRESQANDYLTVGRQRRIGTAATGSTSLKDALRKVGRHRPKSGAVHRAWQPDVDALAERTRREQERLAKLAEEEMTRKQEREAQRELSLRLIDIGYRVLAKELHPDKGGSREMMARLNRARDHLKQMA